MHEVIKALSLSQQLKNSKKTQIEDESILSLWTVFHLI